MKTALSLDPRSKLVMVLVISSLAVWTRDLLILAFLLVLSAAACLLVGSSMAGLLRKGKYFLWLFLTMVIIQSLFSARGEPLLAVERYVLVSDAGLVMGGQTIIRFLIIMTSALVMLSSHSRAIIQGLVQWKVPYELAFMVSVAIRFLPLLQEEIMDMMTAIQLRGVNLRRIPLFRRLKTYAYLLMPMLASVLIKSRELSMAMEMRAFRAHPNRTSYRMLAFTAPDYYVMAVSGVVLAATAWLIIVS